MATYNFDATTVQTKEGQRSLLSKTFLYMFLMVLGTVITSIAVSLIFQACGLNTDPGSVIPEATARAYVITMITASIMQIVLTIALVFTCIKPGKVAIVPMALYAICMGVLISSFSLWLTWWTLAGAFLIAALAFGGMALIGLFSKRASAMGMVGFGLLFSVLLVSLFSIFFVFFAPRAYLGINLAVSIIVVIAIMLITAYDVYNIKRISATGMNSSNLALYLAFNLYVDFIIILIRILQFIVIFTGGNRR